ncbi:hypothetical protein Tco_0184220 [Tanacetum coccineum]
MEVLNLLIKKHVSLSKDFKYHWLCKDLNLTHICFADDMLLFCHGDSKSVAVLKKAIDEFGDISGLLLSIPKSIVIFGNVKDIARARILKVMPLNVGVLPVKHLGVPLISKRLFSKDCLPLIDKVRNKVMDWKNKSLSFAGRLQLISSVIGSMQIYWSSMFILPVAISNDIERLMRDFLWNYGVFKKGKAKVKWSDALADVIDNEEWFWPIDLSNRLVDFAVSSVWNDIRGFLGRLKTQDKIGINVYVYFTLINEIEIDENLRFVEEPIEIVERDVKKLKRSRIPLVKVRWNSRQGAEYTWEREDQFRKKYPHLFSEPVPSSNVAT